MKWFLMISKKRIAESICLATLVLLFGCGNDNKPPTWIVEESSSVGDSDNQTGDDAGVGVSGNRDVSSDTTGEPIDHCAAKTHTCLSNETCVFTESEAFDCVRLSFVSTWTSYNVGQSDDDQISLPLTSSGMYDFTVDWGDGTSDHITSWDQAEKVHTFAEPGTYTLRISGTIVGWAFRPKHTSNPDATKLTEVSQWGPLRLGNSGGYFHGAENLVITATDTLDISGTTDMRSLFENCESLTNVSGIDYWDVSRVTDMRNLFRGASAFNQDLSRWDVSNVTNMVGMFWGAEAFDQDLSQWDVASVKNMGGMFAHTSVNHDISRWDVSSAINMKLMFWRAEAFDQDLSQWNVSNVTTMERMFMEAEAFDQDLSPWEVSSVTSMDKMFNGATSFDQDLSQWDFSNVDSMKNMFSGVTLSTSNYDALLNRLSANLVRRGMTFDGGDSKYSSAGATARESLIYDQHWSISDGGPE